MRKKRKKFSRADFINTCADSVESSNDRQESFGATKSIFIDDVELPMWRPKEGQHCFDIIPYKAGEFDTNTKEGKTSHVLDIWVHRFVGPDNDEHIVCPKKNYRKSCPICSDIQRLQKSGDFEEKEIKSLKAKRRTIYNVVVVDGGKEEEKGVQLWDVAHFYMEDKLSGLSRGVPGRGGIIVFPDIDNGKTISFEIKKGGDNVPPAYVSHQFIDRNYKIEEDILNSTEVLDEIIKILSYEEIESLYFGEHPKKEKATVDEDEDFESISDDSVEVDDDDDPLGLDDDDDSDDPLGLDDEEEEEEEDTPPRKRRRR